MIVRTFLITISRALGVVLVFIYTTGTALVFVGVINATSYLANMTYVALLGWPIAIAENQYIEKDMEEEIETHTKKK